eukprot:m51a1_g13109 putative activating signal cointegrator 1 complex subunit 1 (167) ;mRNA; f:36-595
MLRLHGQTALARACGALEGVGAEVARELAGARVRVEGLGYMNDDPADVDVLYACVREDEGCAALQRAAAVVRGALDRAGMLDERQKEQGLKLHATVINTKHRRQQKTLDPATGEDLPQERISFDARRVLAEFGGFYFGDMDVRCFHLSKRGSYDSDGYFSKVVTIP